MNLCQQCTDKCYMGKEYIEVLHCVLVVPTCTDCANLKIDGCRFSGMCRGLDVARMDCRYVRNREIKMNVCEKCGNVCDKNRAHEIKRFNLKLVPTCIECARFKGGGCGFAHVCRGLSLNSNRCYFVEREGV